MRFDKQLVARIKARNRAGEIAKELFPQFVAIFKPLVGQKVCKVDGGFLKKILDQLPANDYRDADPTVMYYRHTSVYTVSFTVKACASDGQGGCAYEEVTVYVADLSNGVVADKEYAPPDCRTDYTAAEIERLRIVYKEKQKEADQALADLYPLGD